MSDNLSPPPANSPEARTPTGEILNQAPTQPTTTPTPSTEPTTNDPAASPKPDASAVPDKYDFKAPEGSAFDADLAAAATPVFKELGLTQPQADKLVEFWNTHAKLESDRALDVIKTQSAKWTEQFNADPELGPNKDKIRTEIGRAFDLLGDAKTVDGFREAMDLTGAGNNPAFIKLFWKLAQRVTAGTHVSGSGAVTTDARGAITGSQRPSIAAALYPKNP